MKKEFRTPYLIQRLKKPFQTENNLSKFANAFAFGGGYKNGGLTDEAAELLRKIWRYDYMGSAEFEWGAVPKSLSYIFENRNDYKVFTINVDSQYYDHYNKKELICKSNCSVYVVCHEYNQKDVEKWIKEFAVDSSLVRTKEHVGLNEALCIPEKYDVCGWHDIDNHFLFFSDSDMWLSFINLMGVSTTSGISGQSEK